jgi:hypothetical protein
MNVKELLCEIFVLRVPFHALGTFQSLMHSLNLKFSSLSNETGEGGSRNERVI